MANMIGIIDPDPDRRRRFAEDVAPLVAPMPGLVVEQAGAGDLHLAWAAPADAPHTRDVSEDGMSLVLGTPTEPGTGLIDAPALGRLWAGEAPPPFDGVYCALRYDRREGLTAGVDLLGCFPLYWFVGGGVVLIGSSPDLFRHHPSFSARLSWPGLAGILMTMHLTDQQPLLQDVRRLRPGHLLRWDPTGGVTERRQYEVPISDALFGLPPSRQIEELDHVVTDAVDRHTAVLPGSSLLLSGGHDSRWMGGIAVEQGRLSQAVTLGRPTDIEVRCAAPVARALGLEHTVSDPDLGRYPEAATTQVALEHLNGGLNFLYEPHLAGVLRGRSRGVLTGFLTDVLISGSHQRMWHLGQPAIASFDAFFAMENSWALPPRLLMRLLRTPDARDLVYGLLLRYRDGYETKPGTHLQRALAFDLEERQRHHIGRLIWSVSFGAWPIVPMIDREVLRVAASLPPGIMTDRRAQRRIIAARFPRLARLPVDRNGWNTAPIAPSLRWRAGRAARGALRRIGVREAPVDRDRLFYYRVMDFNHEGWRPVRERAHRAGDGAGDVLDLRALGEALPPWDRTIRPQRPVARWSGMKLLTGLLLWLERERSGSASTHGATVTETGTVAR